MNEGRLEIRPPGGEWGTVCQATSNNICDLPENQDMCYRLGYVGTYSFGAAGEQYGKVNGPIWSMGVQCTNYMMTARQCWMRDWSFQQMSCDHSSDWALLCITGEAHEQPSFIYFNILIYRIHISTYISLMAL